MKQYFPGLDLNKVEFCINSSLPPNWFERPNKVAAMTFGYRIYFKGTDIQKNRAGLELQMHELVHVDQVRRRRSEIAFARDYGQGYLEAGSYRANPMEVEAYDFVTRCGGSLPDGTGVVTHMHPEPACKEGQHHGSCAGMKTFVHCMPIPLPVGPRKCACTHSK